MIEELLSKLSIDPLFIVICSIATLLSLIFGFIFYYKSKKYKRLSYTLYTFNLLNEKLKGVEGLEVFYKTNQVSNLSVTELSFWNSGTETIEGSDLAKNNKLSIQTNTNVFILSSKIISANNSSKGIKLTPDVNDAGEYVALSIDIDFDFLNSQEGMTLQLYHTGTSSDDIKLIGAIKGIKQIHRVNHPNEHTVELTLATDGFTSLVNTFPTTRIALAVFLIFGCFYRLFILSTTNSLADYIVAVILVSIAYYNINSYIRNKKNILPKWVYQKQSTPKEQEVD